VKIISTLFKLSELLPYDIYNVEHIEYNRISYDYLSAIYFITPTAGSVKELVKDFENPKKPKYRSVNILYSNRMYKQMRKII